MKPYQNPISETSSVTLDLVRVIAAQMVVIGHGIGFSGIAPWFQPPNFIYIQSMAVVIFFILSGVLTSHSIFRKISKQNEGYSFRTFLIERFSRIYSVYVVALFFVLILDSVSIYALGGYDRYGSYTPYDFITNLFMLQDGGWRLSDSFLHTSFFGSEAFGTGRPFWTIAPEWWIYMFFGFYILNRKIMRNRILNKLLYYSILVPLIILASVKYTLVLAWMAGVVITLLLSGEHNARKKRKQEYSSDQFILSTKRIFGPPRDFLANPFFSLLVAGLCFGAGIVRGIYIGDVYDPLFVLWSAAGIFFLLSFANRTRKTFSKKATKTIRWLAGYTFTLFLTHYTIFEFTRILGVSSPYLYFFIGYSVSNITAIVIAHFTERRQLQFRAFLLRHLDRKKSLEAVSESYAGMNLRGRHMLYAVLKGFIAGLMAFAVLSFAGISPVFGTLFGLVVGLMVGGTQIIIAETSVL